MGRGREAGLKEQAGNSPGATVKRGDGSPAVEGDGNSGAGWRRGETKKSPGGPSCVCVIPVRGAAFSSCALRGEYGGTGPGCPFPEHRQEGHSQFEEEQVGCLPLRWVNLESH